LAVGCLGVVLLAGCGSGDSVARNHVAGSVTYDGANVPAGVIYFDPDSKKGGSGPQGFAPIKDGRYDTREGGKGGPAGAVTVRIEGFDGQAAEGRPMGHAVFTYQTSADLGQGDATKDFAIKAAEAKKAVKDSGPPP
jgi:hypothetical protein